MKTQRDRHATDRKSGSRKLFAGLAVLTTILVFGWPPDLTHGQSDPRKQRREFVEQMLRSLIESQVGPSNEPNVERAAARTDPAASQQVRDAQANLAAISQELSNLVSQLHNDVDRVPGVRPLLADLLRVSASATVLSRRSATARDLTGLADEFRDMDRNWRLVANRLNQVRGLDARAQGYIQRCSDFNARLGELFSVAPQMDRDELVEHVTQLSNDILNLIDEIDIEVDNASKRQELLLDGQRVFAQVRRLTRLVASDEPHDVVRQEYDAFRRLWTPLAGKIRTLDDRNLTRQVLRIQSTDRTIQELLWMPTGVDPSELENMAVLLQRDIDELMDGVTLRQLAQLTNGRDRIIPAAGDFYSACGDFAECVRNGDDNSTLVEVYYYLDDSWRRFASLARDLESRPTRQRLRSIERGVVELRDALRVPPGADRTRGIELAGSLDNLADHLHGDLERVFSRQRFPQDFQSRCLLASKEFRNSAKALHSELVKDETPRNARQRCDELSKNWETLVAYTTRLPAAEQGHLNAVRRRITPLLVDLQTMYAL